MNIRKISSQREKPRQAPPAVSAERAHLLHAAATQFAGRPGVVPTVALENGERPLIPENLDKPFGIEHRGVAQYFTLPVEPERQHPDGLHWRVHLVGLFPGGKPVGLDVLGDVILGRGTDPDSRPDLNLDVFGARHQGVSRQHALLRPTRLSLYLLDLNSTNGTRFNACPLNVGMTRPITDGCTIALGDLTFEVRIIQAP